MMLNTDQQAALIDIRKWWRSKDLFMVLDGAGGTGKSYLLDEVVNSLGCAVLLLCPTHEALKQLKDKVTGNYEFRTVHSALGISPTVNEHEIKFSQIALPKIWDNVQLVIIDEASMISQDILDILLKLNKKILFVGHKSQLPPVDTKRAIFDKCVSPVFEQNFPTASLTIPMRNTGELWEFNNYLEKIIYTSDRIIPNTFDIKKKELDQYIDSEEGKKDIFAGNTKFVLWSNKGTDTYNKQIRLKLYGEQAKNNMYLPGDKILITKPLTIVEGLPSYRDSALSKIVTSKDIPKLFANTKAEVIDVSEVDIILNAKLQFRCYKLNVETDEGRFPFYELKDKEQMTTIADYYKHQAWAKKDSVQRGKAFMFGHFVVSLFADIKHSYAMTAHRLQGSSIPNIITVYNDIQKNMNIIEQKKCLYVACSRTKDNLMFYRG